MLFKRLAARRLVTQGRLIERRPTELESNAVLVNYNVFMRKTTRRLFLRHVARSSEQVLGGAFQLRVFPHTLHTHTS